MDVKLEKENIVFIYRVSALIINDNKILFQRNKDVEYLTLPGGKCSIGESSIEAISRELLEEIGVNVKFVRTRAVIENFFVSSFNNKNYHEILIINEMLIDDDEFLNKKILENIENKPRNHEYYEWIDISKLNQYILKPNFLSKVINSNNIFYKINK